MRTTTSWTHTLAKTLVLLLAFSCALILPAMQAAAQDGEYGRARGAITVNDPGTKLLIEWYTPEWVKVKSYKTTNSFYVTNLPAGKYYLKATDLRPAWDTNKYAPAARTVIIETGKTTIANLRLQKGAALGGVVRAGGKNSGGARIVATSKNNQVFETTADKQGNFALAGLPGGDYSVFVYERTKTWTSKALWVNNLKQGTWRTVEPSLDTKAGNLLIDLYAGDTLFPDRTWVTIVSKTTGQFWITKTHNGAAAFKGVYPGKYTIKMPGVGAWLGRTTEVKGATVRGGKLAFGYAKLIEKGATITGLVQGATQLGKPDLLPQTKVTLFGPKGNILGVTYTNEQGQFVLDDQLYAGENLTLILGPADTSNPWLGPVNHKCRYQSATINNITIAQGQTTNLGTITLELTADEEQPATCTQIIPAT